jgi:hypothetical protein
MFPVRYEHLLHIKGRAIAVTGRGGLSGVSEFCIDMRYD